MLHVLGPERGGGEEGGGGGVVRGSVSDGRVLFTNAFRSLGSRLIICLKILKENFLIGKWTGYQIGFPPEI
jgi:hypothetical protein